MVNIEIRLIIFFADKDGEALISQQKQDLELTGSNNELLIARSYGRRHWHPTPVLLPGESHGRGAWWAAIYGVTQSRTRLSN